jgi:hypothetical protein
MIIYLIKDNGKMEKMLQIYLQKFIDVKRPMIQVENLGETRYHDDYHFNSPKIIDSKYNIYYIC